MVVQLESGQEQHEQVDLDGVVFDLQRKLARELITRDKFDRPCGQRGALADDEELAKQLPIEFSGHRLSSDTNWKSAGVCDGAQLCAFENELQRKYEELWSESENCVPLDGLCLWLSADEGVTTKNGRVVNWKNSAHPDLSQLNCLPFCDGHPVLQNGSDQHPHISFGYNQTGTLSPPLPDGVRTIISVHKFDDQQAQKDGIACQFYIFSGSAQGPFHCDGGQHTTRGRSGISSGDGSWAGGTAFAQGHVRFDGTSKRVPVSQVKTGDFDEFRLAVVECAAGGVTNQRGPGMDRIGRDRNCHAFTGQVQQVMVWQRQLSDEEIERLGRYLLRRWF